ncbi:unnamed protein product [Allacma fusca]|uniref:Uncharacterized protein n=1 Tax=Allacma fusca TaxID=39272 RepID=A0A8J2L8Z2_9HEXA|nr:unnamed protein product [Allacma fusca]
MIRITIHRSLYRQLHPRKERKDSQTFDAVWSAKGQGTVEGKWDRNVVVLLYPWKCGTGIDFADQFLSESNDLPINRGGRDP